MLQSLIIITSQLNLETASKYSQIDPTKDSIDIIKVGESDVKIGIDISRQIQSFLSTTPLSQPQKLVIINFAHNLTHQAQNALLKTLEEPPSYAQIILLANNTAKILPTILSRCQIIYHQKTQPKPDSNFDQTSELVLKLATANPGKKISLSDSYNKDATTSKQLTTNLIDYFRSQLKSTPNHKNLYNLTLTLYTHKLLGQNVNPKLSIDNLFLNLK